MPCLAPDVDADVGRPCACARVCVGWKRWRAECDSGAGKRSVSECLALRIGSEYDVQFGKGTAPSSLFGHVTCGPVHNEREAQCVICVGKQKPVHAPYKSRSLENYLVQSIPSRKCNFLLCFVELLQCRCKIERAQQYDKLRSVLEIQYAYTDYVTAGILV